MNIVYRHGSQSEAVTIWKNTDNTYSITCTKADWMVRYTGVGRSYLDKAMHDVGYDDRFISNVLDQI